MPDEPRIVALESTPVALLPVTCSRAEVGKAMGPGLDELLAASAARGVAVTGPWRVRAAARSAAEKRCVRRVMEHSSRSVGQRSFRRLLR